MVAEARGTARGAIGGMMVVADSVAGRGLAGMAGRETIGGMVAGCGAHTAGMGAIAAGMVFSATIAIGAARAGIAEIGVDTPTARTVFEPASG
ncbi:MAG: hypothetical protein ABSG68_14265 [Thermoguttaceae bacterium]